MIHEDFHVEMASWERDGAQLRALREQVFVLEQGVAAADELDALDAQSVHVAARGADGSVIGTARLTPARSIGRMAVLREWRGRGVGEAMLRTLVEYARARGWPELDLHAQSHAIGFYERAGFVAE
ncbi:MAG: GNAT family N-acetyltransferase, partial [Dokdonella sp.]